MPKCYMNAIRGYRTGKYKGTSDHDPHVMTTRSGLSIRKIAAPKGLGVSVRTTAPIPRPRRENTTPRKYPVLKYKSLSYMSFVTRFIIALRVPELELAGVNPRETLEYLAEDEYFYNSGSTSSYSTSGVESCEDEGDSDLDVEVLEGVDDNVFYEVEDENQNSQGSNDILCRSVNDIRLNDNINGEQHQTNSIVSTCQTLKVKYLDVSISGSSEPDSHEASVTSNSSKTEIQHESQLPYKCQECDRRFTIFSAYTTHVRSHTNQRPRCGICGKIFTRSWLLKGHMRTHTGERPFPCPAEGCDKAFADKSNLRSHMLIHSVTSKNFTCEKCGRAFAQKRYLHKHMLEVCRLI